MLDLVFGSVLSHLWSLSGFKCPRRSRCLRRGQGSVRVQTKYYYLPEYEIRKQNQAISNGLFP